MGRSGRLMSCWTRRTCAALVFGAIFASGAPGVSDAESWEEHSPRGDSDSDLPSASDSPAATVALDLAQPASEAVANGALGVGSIAELDLAKMRAMIAAAEPVDARADQEIRQLTLEESLQVALTNNLDIHVSQLGVTFGRDVVAEQKSVFHPDVGALGDAEGFNRDRSGGRPDERRDRERALVFVEQQLPTGGSVRLGAGYEREATSKNSEQDVTTNFDNTLQLAGLSIEVMQPLLRGGRIYVARSGIIDAEYGDEINRSILSKSMLDVKARTKEAYYNVVRAGRQVEVVERALVRDQELVDASNALYEAGRTSKVDVYSAEVGLANDEARLATSHAEHEVQQNELRRVLGLPVGVKIEAADTEIPFLPVPVDLTGWITRALRNRPELLQMRAELKRAEQNKRVAKNGKLPELGVSGGFQPGFDWASYNWQAGLNFRMPIGNRGPQARYRQSESARALAQTKLYRTQRAIELEVRGLEIRLRESIERITSLSHVVESARAKREVAAGRFELGLASNLDVVNADEELIRAETQLLTAVADHASTLGFLESAIGGSL